jgi:hypothetical protein
MARGGDGEEPVHHGSGRIRISKHQRLDRRTGRSDKKLQSQNRALQESVLKEYSTE